MNIQLNISLSHDRRSNQVVLGRSRSDKNLKNDTFDELYDIIKRSASKEVVYEFSYHSNCLLIAFAIPDPKINS